MEQLLYHYLRNYTQSGIYPFHMPGHKRNRDFLSFEEDPVLIDVTEVDSTDNLQNPSGILKMVEEKAAALFGADKTYLLANGSTGGILAALLCAVFDGDKVIMARNSHMSGFSGLALSGARPVYIYPPVSEDGIAGPIAPSVVEAAFKAHSEVKAVFLTSPTYEGITSNIKEISAIAHRYKALLIVDEAHGAHFNFHTAFPRSAVLDGADMVIQSLHKTLPSLTQTALLHVKGSMVNRLRLRQCLNMVNSSSPSYVLLSSIDKCLSFIEMNQEAFERHVLRLSRFRQDMAGLRTIRLADEKYLENAFHAAWGGACLDPSKLVFIAAQACEIADILEKDYAIQLEAANYNFMLAMTSPADTEAGFQRLVQAIKEIDRHTPKGGKRVYGTYPIAKEKLSMRKAMFSNTVERTLSEAVGSIAAEQITPYPPGVPIILPGEEITQEAIRWLGTDYYEKRIEIVEELN